MIDIEKLSLEFAFLRDKLKETASLIKNGDISEACFAIGSLYSLCHNHSVALTRLLPQKVKEEPQDEQQAL